MLQLGLTQEQWQELPYFDRVEWVAYFVNENKKQAVLQVESEEQNRKREQEARRKRK